MANGLGGRYFSTLYLSPRSHVQRYTVVIVIILIIITTVAIVIVIAIVLIITIFISLLLSILCLPQNSSFPRFPLSLLGTLVHNSFITSIPLHYVSPSSLSLPLFSLLCTLSPLNAVAVRLDPRLRSCCNEIQPFVSHTASRSALWQAAGSFPFTFGAKISGGESGRCCCLHPLSLSFS